MTLTPKRQISQLLIKLLILFLPFLIILSFPLFVLFKTGELQSIDKVIERQKSKDKTILLGLAYSNPIEYYKIQSVIKRKPQVITLGTSRVMEFRSQFFNSQTNFYNAGGAVARLRHFQTFLDQIPIGQEPEIIIIGLDQYFFNPNWDKGKDDDILNRYNTTSEKSNIVMNNFLKVYHDLYNKKFSIQSLLATNDTKIGLNAFINSSGYINDGSHNISNATTSPNKLPSHEDFQFKDTFLRIKMGDRRFEYSNTVDAKSLHELNIFLNKCSKRNIYIIGFLPPYAPTVFNKMVSMGEKYSYLLKLYSSLVPVFNSYNYPIYEFSDLTSLNSSDEEALDGFHGSEKAYLRLFIKMAEEDSILRQKTDLAFLKRKLSHTKGDIVVFE